MKPKNSVEALRGVSLEIGENESFGLIGKNGAGKTTLTKIIATLVQPTEGSVEVHGFDSVKDDVKVRSLVGLATAEERSFYWRLTCLQNMLFFSRLHGMSEKEAKSRITELFEHLGIEEYAKRRFSELSTGNKQKLAVARALLTKPRVLLLDEPTRSLDPIAAASMREQVAALEDVTILLTSHNLSEIEELCDRVAVISKGVIRAVGTPKELRSENQQKQKVTIEIDGLRNGELNDLEYLDEFSIQKHGQFHELRFERDVEDELLGKTVSFLENKGLRIVNVETYQSSLLEVLEKFE